MQGHPRARPGPRRVVGVLATDDATKTVEAASAGAQVLIPPMPVGEMGAVAVPATPTVSDASDPTGWSSSW